MALHLLILILSVGALALSANLIIKGITNVANYLKWREFVLAFFVVAVGSALANLAVGISAAARGVPELSFGDILGNNVVIFTLVVASVVYFGGRLQIQSRVIEKSAIFAAVAALLPLLLILDGHLGRGDAIALIIIFIIYNGWLFSKRKLFITTREEDSVNTHTPFKRFSSFIKNIGLTFVGMALLALSATGMVESAVYFSGVLGVPIVIVGIVVVGLLTSLPELYFATVAARKGYDRIAIGEILGEVTVLSTLVLGIVALIHPIEVADFSPFFIARFFLILSIFLFLIFVRTNGAISKPEAAMLFIVYIAFVASQIYLGVFEGYDIVLPE